MTTHVTIHRTYDGKVPYFVVASLILHQVLNKNVAHVISKHKVEIGLVQEPSLNAVKHALAKRGKRVLGTITCNTRQRQR